MVAERLSTDLQVQDCGDTLRGGSLGVAETTGQRIAYQEGKIFMGQEIRGGDRLSRVGAGDSFYSRIPGMGGSWREMCRRGSFMGSFGCAEAHDPWGL